MQINLNVVTSEIIAYIKAFESEEEELEQQNIAVKFTLVPSYYSLGKDNGMLGLEIKALGY